MSVRLEDNDLAFDSDGDGLIDADELEILHTNPLMPDRPRIAPSLSCEKGVFGLSIEGTYGRSLTLKASTDLTNWFTVTNVSAGTDPIRLQDATGGTNQQRFYRVVMP